VPSVAKISVGGRTGSSVSDSSSMTKTRKHQDEKRIELVPDAWARFERFVKDIAKAGPQHRVAKPKTRSVSKGRVHKGKTRV
jgi:hypothetical protein